MMIAKQEWFERRKYTGWGLTPKTWQGWLYISVFVIIIIALQALPVGSLAKMYATGAIVLLLMLDITHVMFTLKLDERDYKIEAISERNAAWAMVLVIGCGILYRALQAAASGNANIDPILFIVLAAGVSAKALSNIILERKAL